MIDAKMIKALQIYLCDHTGAYLGCRRHAFYASPWHESALSRKIIEKSVGCSYKKLIKNIKDTIKKSYAE
jgi:hypothetical protein